MKLNNTFAYILTFGLLMMGGAAMGQRDGGVQVGGSVFGGGNLADVKGSSAVSINQNGATIAQDVYGGGAKALVNVTTENNENSWTEGATTSVTLTKGNVTGNVYGGGLGVRPADSEDPGTPADVYGPVTVTINGGTVAGSVFGCNNEFGAPQSTVNVNITKTGEAMTIHNVYGGGNLADYTAPTATNEAPTAHDYPHVNVNHGTVGGSVFGGGYGATATVDGNPQVTIGDDNSDHTATVSGNVYGGGDLAAVTGSPYIKVWNANSAVSQEVYGGGNQANVSGSTTVDIIAGTITENVYGGGALADVGTSAIDNTTVNILGGTISGNVYGGGLGRKAGENVTEIAATVNGVVTVNIGAAPVPPSTEYTGVATINGSVFGCNNTNGTPTDNVTVNVYKTERTDEQQADYTEDDREYALYQVFGGGNEAHYQPISSGKKATVHVWTCDNTIQYVYGGGNAANVGTDGDGNIKSATDVIIDGGRIEWVFGGGNGAGLPAQHPGANIYGNVNVTYHAGNLTYLFGGSNEKGNISGDKTVAILADGECPTKYIAELYGGSNKAPINGNVELTMGCQTGMDESFKIGSLFGGSRQANISGNVTLNVEGGKYDYVFGGNNENGTISGNVTLNLKGGTINEAAFGGNKGGGSINGNITVNVEDANNSCPLIVKDVFGAGDQAMYTAPTGEGAQANNPIVYVKHLRAGQTISGNVYGGGNGDPDDDSQEPGMVTGNPKVVIGDMTEGYRAAISGNVYGGGNAAKVDGTTTVLMQKDNSTVAQNIYGGGNLANVTGATDVDINGGTVSLDVYGGGALANTGGSNVTLGGGTVTQDIYGGGLGDNGHAAEVNGAVQVTVNSGVVRDVYGCNNTNGAPTSTVRVDINNNVSGNVYGGGNQAGSLSGHDISPEVYVNNGTVVNVFGGGKGNTAVITGNPQVTIGDADENHYAVVSQAVYGGGDAAKVMGSTTVEYKDNNSDSRVGNIFGGGNNITESGQGVSGSTTVTMTSGNLGEVTSNVYGGCNASGTVQNTTNVEIKGGTVHGSVFGGGYGASTVVTGTANVEISGSSAVDNDVYGGGDQGVVNGGTVVNVKAN